MNVGDHNFEAADTGCAEHSLRSETHCSMMSVSPLADGAVLFVDGNRRPALDLGPQTSGRLEFHLAETRTWALSSSSSCIQVDGLSG